LDPEVLIEQLHDMFLHDARSVCPVPMPPEFEPENFNNQMDPPYLSEGFFQRVRLVVEEAARLGMSYWLYDEGGWPSGNACGRLLHLRPDLVAKVMRLENGAWVPGEVPRFASLEEAGTRLRHPDTDLLDPETALTFMETTYAAYESAVGEHFARTIMFAFTDEPAFRPVKPGEEVPWTRGLEEDFRRSFGYSILDRLNVFSHSSSRLSSRDKEARIDFFDWVSRRFRASFLDTLRDWCRRRGLVLTGHLGGEHEALGALEHGFGNVLLALGGMDAPGIDVISRQIFPGKENPEFVKYASSIAHQKGSPYVVSESFALYGNGLTPQQMKWIVDFQYVRGITLLVISSYPLSTRDHFMPGIRPIFGPVNPLWRYMPLLHRYIARLGYALSL